MSWVPETAEKRNGPHSIVMHKVAWVDEQPGVDENEIGPVELTIGRLQVEPLVIQSVQRERESVGEERRAGEREREGEHEGESERERKE